MVPRLLSILDLRFISRLPRSGWTSSTDRTVGAAAVPELARSPVTRSPRRLYVSSRVRRAAG